MMLGRWINRILVWGLLLSIVATVLLGVGDNDAFLTALIASALFALGTCGIWVGTRPADGMRGARDGEPVCWSTH